MSRVAWLMLLASLPVSAASAADEAGDAFVGSVPQELHQLMAERQCSPIKGFYARPHTIVEPPFGYGFGVLGGDTLVFFACELDSPKASSRYMIVLLRRSYSAGSGRTYLDLGICPSEIHFDNYMPYGLSLGYPLPSMEGVPYYSWQDTRPGLRKAKEANLADVVDSATWFLNDGIAGAGTAFFCLDGAWHYIPYH